MDASTLPVHERLLLLVLDDVKGTCRSSYADPALAGAVLLDLLRTGAVDTVGEQLVVPAGAVPETGVLADAAAEIAAEPEPRDVRWWVDHLPGRLKPFLPRLGARLVEAGVLRLEEHKVLRLFSSTRLPGCDRAPEAAVRERLRAVLLGERAPEDEDAILARLVAAIDLVDLVVGDEYAAAATQRAAALGRDTGLGEAQQRAIRAAEDAVTATIVAATLPATMSASTVLA